ncbi:MAG: hypothetical protein Q8N53_03495 [Longimicrobiales bacterium]|nr:hypothetical protein [Longimicrobiales bacterium]
MKVNGYLFALSLVLLTASAAAVGRVSAASYDGTYDLSYSYNSPNGWKWITLEGGLIVSGGETSSPRSGYFMGSVDSNGYVEMLSPDPQAPSILATWTGTIYSDGTGDGDWESPYGYGTWTVERVSGPLGDTVTIALAGGLMGLGGVSVLYSMGYGTVKGKFMSKGAAAASPPKWRGRVRSMGFWSGPPGPTGSTGVVTRGLPPFIGEPARNQSPPGGLPPFIGQQGPGGPQPGDLPPFIGYGGGGVAATGPGARVGGDLFPRLETLFGRRIAGGMEFWWEPPRFNPETEQLVGYRVYAGMYGPGGTAPAEVLLNPPFGPGVTRGFATFNQTYRFSTGGDVVGFRVEPMFFRFSGPNPGVFPGQASTFLPW